MGKPKSGSAKMSKKEQKFFCPCGGEIAMVTRIVGGKHKSVAYCKKCRVEKRRPGEFNA